MNPPSPVRARAGERGSLAAMRQNVYFQLGLIFLGLRILLGAFFMLVQWSSPAEGGMIVLVDLPTLVFEFGWSYIFGWPTAVVDAFDLTFHAFGLVTWFLMGAALGWLVSVINKRRVEPTGG